MCLSDKFRVTYMEYKACTVAPRRTSDAHVCVIGRLSRSPKRLFADPTRPLSITTNRKQTLREFTCRRSINQHYHILYCCHSATVRCMYFDRWNPLLTTGRKRALRESHAIVVVIIILKLLLLRLLFPLCRIATL